MTVASKEVIYYLYTNPDQNLFSSGERFHWISVCFTNKGLWNLQTTAGNFSIPKDQIFVEYRVRSEFSSDMLDTEGGLFKKFRRQAFEMIRS